MTEPTRGVPDLPADFSHEVRNALACIHQFGKIMLDGRILGN
jgi:hypothetical protein